jgi:hypothetical protein
MRFLRITLLFLVFVVFANGGKVNWDSQGKPQIEKSEKPVKGCMQGGLESLGQDNNNTSDCKKEK